MIVELEYMKELYNKLAQFSNKPDFSHMMIAGAAELSNSPKFFANIAARGKTVRAAGWLGDVSTIALDMAPSIGNDDYKADLDAVNIVRRIQNGSGSFADTVRHYYNELDRSTTNRAKEFQRHYKIKDIINEINNVDTSGKHTAGKRDFVSSLEQNSNDYIMKEST